MASAVSILPARDFQPQGRDRGFAVLVLDEEGACLNLGLLTVDEQIEYLYQLATAATHLMTQVRAHAAAEAAS